MVPAVDQVRLARFYLDAAAPWQSLALLDALPHDDRADPTVAVLRARALHELGRPEQAARERTADLLARTAH